MLKKYLAMSLLLIVAIFAINGCAKKGNSADEKKAELAKLKTQLLDIQTKINSIEKELAAEGKDGKSSNVVPVSILELKPEIFKRFLEIQGAVESEKSIMLSPKMSGQVIKLNVQNGASVKKGQVILEIDDDVLQKSLSELENAFDLVNTVYEKQKRLWEQKAGSEIQYLQAKNNKEGLEKKISTLKQQISWCKLTAPFAGVVDNITPKIGEMVGAGMPAVKLTSMDDIKISAEVSESYASSVKQGNPVRITFPELNQTIETKVNFVSKSIDPRNRTFRVEMKLPKSVAGLRPNLVCSVGINDVTQNDSRIVPLSIIQKSGDKQYLFVAVDENGLKAKKVFVQTGYTEKNNVTITDGLNFGDKVITGGAFDVADGQAVSIK